MLNHTLVSDIAQGRAFSCVTLASQEQLQQLLSLESHGKKICEGSWRKECGLGGEQDLKFLIILS